MKFTFIAKRTDLHGNTKSTLTLDTEEELISNIVSEFKLFLKGCGYCSESVDELLGEE
jgi:hypothetical protein